jgi:hypothetical protein
MPKTVKEEVVENLEDVKPVDDFFEKILNEDIEPPTDDEDTDASEKETVEEKESEEATKEESEEDKKES